MYPILSPANPRSLEWEVTTIDLSWWSKIKGYLVLSKIIFLYGSSEIRYISVPRFFYFSWMISPNFCIVSFG